MSEPKRSPTTFTDAGSRKAVACRIRTGCIHGWTHSLRGESVSSTLPIPPPDGELLLAFEVIFGDRWPALREDNADVSGDAFRGQADGCF
jgi:hypothetical protein